MTSKWGDVVRSINDTPDFGAILIQRVCNRSTTCRQWKGCDSVHT